MYFRIEASFFNNLLFSLFCVSLFPPLDLPNSTPQPAVIGDIDSFDNTHIDITCSVASILIFLDKNVLGYFFFLFLELSSSLLKHTSIVL